MMPSSSSSVGGADQQQQQMPDADAIKMFVGQVPKSWSENDVRLYFQEFGSIYLVNVLRDKLTKQSRGCCFVTYYKRKSALDAQNACHNLKTLPGMNHPLQMKPADNENRAERKIFVGMLSKKMNELDLREMFCRFGLIEECSILRDGNNLSRGCGFVTFSSKACALNAIKTMHHSTTMDGCSSPLVVKFADVQRDRVTKDAIALLSSLAEAKASSNHHHHMKSGGVTSASTNLAQHQQQYLPVLHLLQQQQHQQQGSYGLPMMQQQSSAADMSTLTFLANLAANVAPVGAPPSSNNNSRGGELSRSSIPPPACSPTASMSSINNNSCCSHYNFPSQTEGPDGSNLFIYHLPQEFGDADLFQAFLPFGTILSAKVFIDKATNLSKCFGFVSYDNAISAHLAIQAMNGFQIGPKRLKVQLKRAKDKPY